MPCSLGSRKERWLFMVIRKMLCVQTSHHFSCVCNRLSEDPTKQDSCVGLAIRWCYLPLASYLTRRAQSSRPRGPVASEEGPRPDHRNRQPTSTLTILRSRQSSSSIFLRESDPDPEELVILLRSFRRLVQGSKSHLPPEQQHSPSLQLFNHSVFGRVLAGS